LKAQGALEEVFGQDGLLAAAIPEFEYRRAQLRMAQAVARAIDLGEVLLAEAGTGTGKTLAYLIPAILSGRKTVVSTGTKTLQEQLFFKDIPLLARALSHAFVASLMKGRANYLCRRNLRQALVERHTRPERQKLLTIQKWSARTERGDRAELDFLADDDPLWDDIAAWSESCVGSDCEDYQQCFLTRMRQEAGASDVVIVNHHLLLADAAVRESGLFQVIPTYDVLILDEAHLLEEIATDFFGSEIGNLRIERLLRDTQREGGAGLLADPGISRHLSMLAEAAARFFQTFDLVEGTRRLRPESLDGATGAFGRELIADLALLSDLIQALSQKPEGLVACARRAREQAGILQTILRPQPEESTAAPEVPSVRWVERRGRGVLLRTSPLDVSSDFRRAILESAGSTILTSATLTAAGEFGFLRERLGVETAREFQADSPFDYATQTVLYIPRHLPDPRHPGFIPTAADEIREILEITRGRALVLFTSLEAMTATHRLLTGTLPYPLMVQGEAPRSQLLARLRSDVASVLLATRSFWQGVDVAGEALSCVIVHKLPFGFPGDPVLEARLEHIQRQGGEPFWDYQVPSAIIALRQGLGRLIRSGADRGVLCVLDQRLVTKGYGRAFLESLPPCPQTGEREAIRRFFEKE
jgi:ATP-dependent DNA helicase DinG